MDTSVSDVRYEQALGIILRATPEWVSHLDALPDLTAETTIEAAGLDSLDVVELIMLIEDELHIEIPDDDTGHLKTLGDIARLART